MGRGKIEIKRIENITKRQVTFSKRRTGLLKKSRELSVLCEAQIGVIVFSPTGKLSEFTSLNSTMDQIMERYQAMQGVRISHQDRQDESLQEVNEMRQKVHVTETSIQNLLGHDLRFRSFDDLDKHEQLLDHALHNIRARKKELLQQQLDNLHKAEKNLELENNSMYHWLRGNGQFEDEQQVEMGLYGGGESGEDCENTMLQLSSVVVPPAPPLPELYFQDMWLPTNPNLN